MRVIGNVGIDFLAFAVLRNLSLGLYGVCLKGRGMEEGGQKGNVMFLQLSLLLLLFCLLAVKRRSYRPKGRGRGEGEFVGPFGNASAVSPPPPPPPSLIWDKTLRG